jgi:hypothetical protein
MSNERPDVGAIIQDEGGCAVCSGKTTIEEVKANNKAHNDAGYVKIHVTMKDGGGETLWAKKTENENEFEICNTPFFVTEFGCGDIVKARQTGPHFYEFEAVVKRVRETYYLEYLVEFDEEELKKRFPILLDEFRAKGYTAEGVVTGYLVVGVPYGEGSAGVQEVIDNTKSGLKVKIYEEE